MFLVSLHSSGRPMSLEPSGAETWPFPNGPRKSGQSAREVKTPACKASRGKRLMEWEKWEMRYSVIMGTKWQTDPRESIREVGLKHFKTSTCMLIGSGV